MQIPPDIQERLGLVPLYAIAMRNTASMTMASEQGRALMESHLRWQLALEDARILLAAGPLNWGEDAPGPDGAIGMYVIAARSRQHAEEIAASEPFERAGWRTHVTYGWLVNEGVAVPLAREIAERHG
jgi:uncharacterized protein YciI